MRARMFGFLLPSTAVGQITLVAGASIALLAAACILYRRLQEQNRRLSTALNNMSQGLNMFDAQGRIILLNKRYLQMYKLSPEVVKPGCTLTRLIEYRKETGLFAGDVDSYVKKILEAMSLGKSQEHYVQASDGRIVLAKNEPLPGGGWVSTHEDVTEQRRAEEERAAIRGQEERRASIDSAITSFRPTVETLLSTVSESATAMRSTALALFGSSEHTSQRAESAVHAFHEASANVETAAVAADELSRSIAEISRQLTHTTNIVGLATSEARATDGEIGGLADGAQKIGDVVKLIRNIRGRQTCLHSMPGSRPLARARREKASLLSPRRSSHSRCKPPRQPKTSPIIFSPYRIQLRRQWKPSGRSPRECVRSMKTPRRSLHLLNSRTRQRVRFPATSPAQRKAQGTLYRCSATSPARQRRHALRRKSCATPQKPLTTPWLAYGWGWKISSAR